MKKVLLVGAGNQTSGHLINYLLDENICIRSVYRKTLPRVESSKVLKIQGDVSVDSADGWVHGCDTVIYMAGGDSSHEDGVEHLGAKKLVDASESDGVKRFIYVSALGAHDPNSWGDEFHEYLVAKANGERVVRASDLAWTIVRPGILNNDPGIGKISIKSDETTDPNVSRQDVALAIATSLSLLNTYRTTFDLVSGELPIPEALESLGREA